MKRLILLFIISQLAARPEGGFAEAGNEKKSPVVFDISELNFFVPDEHVLAVASEIRNGNIPAKLTRNYRRGKWQLYELEGQESANDQRPFAQIVAAFEVLREKLEDREEPFVPCSKQLKNLAFKSKETEDGKRVMHVFGVIEKCLNEQSVEAFGGEREPNTPKTVARWSVYN